MAMTRNPAVREVLNQIVSDPRYAEVMRVPVVSLPQWALSILALGGFALSSWAYVVGMLPLWAAMLCNFATVYLAFTPLHDASHRAVSKHPLLNDVLGTSVGQLLIPGINMTVFRAIHMDHHRFTGQVGRDPDTNFVDLPKWLGVSYLMFADINWVIWYARYGRQHWPRREKAWLAIMLTLVVVSHVAFLMSPWWQEFLLLYVIPQRVGLGVVAYTFAHIQHPEGLTWEREPFQSTVYIRGNSPWRRLMFGQEEHVIHHLLPHVPWFKYKRVWELANGVLRKQGIPDRGWFEAAARIELPKPDADAPIAMRVAKIAEVGEAIRAFDFEPVDGTALAAATPGAHVDVHLAEGLVRQYSVVRHDVAANRYRIAVKREDAGRGGSRAMHALRPGEVVRISKPHNHFVLYENASRFILMAGGIGITPLLSMAQRLQDVGKSWELHVCARSEAAIPFRDELLGGPLAHGIRIHLDDKGRSSLDVDTVLNRPQADALVYLCGPQAFMDGLRQAALARGWNEAQIRIESFAAPRLDDSENRPFDLKLARSGRTITVKTEQSILDALNHAGVNVPYACMQGTCGTCVTAVVGGEVEHRDAYLSASDKAANAQMCLCVSRARGDSLSVDL